VLAARADGWLTLADLRSAAPSVSQRQARATSNQPIVMLDQSIVHPPMNSDSTFGVAVSNPTTSSMPASSGSAMLNPFEAIDPRGRT
jgi:hypothetical protein